MPALGGAGLLVIAGGSYLLRHPVRSQAVTREIDSVAVLPFENAASGPDTDFLADGTTQSAIDHLSRLGHLKVISMGSASRYRGKHEDPRQIGRDLGVRSVMVGNIAFRGDRMLVMTELIDATDGTHIWSEQYDRKVSDLMSVQDDIAREIATRLGIRLNAQQQKLLRTRPIADFEAYEIYLRGRLYWNQRSQQDLQRGLEYFQRAIDRDPSNALAYAGLADSYFVLAISGAVPTKETMPKAKVAALKGLELDDSLAEAHTSLAHITANYDWDWSKAESEYKRAIELNPNYSSLQKSRSRGLLEGVPKREECGRGLGAGFRLDTAAIYARLGEKDEAFSLLNQAFEQQHVADELEGGPTIPGLHSDRGT